MIKHIEVTSSNLRSVGYDPDSKELEITFKNGTTYKYWQVPQQEFDSLLAADSKGQYFNKNIKPVYSWSKK